MPTPVADRSSRPVLSEWKGSKDIRNLFRRKNTIPEPEEQPGNEQYVSFPPWSLQFASAALESSYICFVAPAWYESMMVYGTGALIGIANNFVSTRYEFQDDPVNTYIISSKVVQASASAGFLVVHLFLAVMHRMNLLSSVRFHTMSRRFRIVYNIVLLFAASSFALESRTCAAFNHPHAYVEQCVGVYPFLVLTVILVNFIHPIGFNANLVLSTVIPLVELFYSSYSPLAHGQPAEQRFTRPLYAIVVAAHLLPIHYSHEQQDRERFLLAKRLQQLTVTARRRKEQVAASLASFCDPDHLSLLLSGSVVDHTAPVASVMITAIDNYCVWRQGWLPKLALGMIDIVFESLDPIRIGLGIQKVADRGDRLILAHGLQTTSPLPLPRPLESQGADPSRLLAFAAKQCLIILRLKRTWKLPFQLPKLRWGFGRDSCRGFLVPGSVVHYLIWGAAFDQASIELEQSTAGVIEVAESIIATCKEYEIVNQPSSRGGPIRLCTEVKNRAKADDSLAVIDLDRSVESGVDSQVLPDSPVAEDKKAKKACSSSTNMSPSVTSGMGAPMHSSSATLPSREKPPTENDLPKTTYLDLLNPKQPEGYAEFQEQGARTLLPVSLAVWFALLSLYMAIFVIEDSVDAVYGVMLAVGYLALLLPLLPWKFLPCRWIIFTVSLMELAIISSFSVIRQDSLVTKFITPPWISLLCTFVAVARHVPTALVTVVIVCHNTTMFVLAFSHPQRFPWEVQRSVVRLSTGVLFVFAMLIIRAGHHRRVFDFQRRCKSLQDQAIAEKLIHEKVLRMILPEYVVPLVAQKQETGRMADMVADTLPDVSLALFRFQRFSSAEEMLRVSQMLDGFVQKSGSLHLVYADGDTFTCGGPLQRDVKGWEQKPATSSFAGRAMGRFVLERVADQAAMDLIRLVASVINQAACTAVLHRGDGLAVVTGERRPTFSLFGPVCEVARNILEAGYFQTYVASESVALATSTFVEASRNYYDTWKGAGLALGASVPFSMKAGGVQRVSLVLNDVALE
jgi:hypothetical protein